MCGTWKLETGLWQVTLLARGTREQWEALYFPLWHYGNSGERTGPWDFSLDPERKGTPLLPAFWVYLNGRKLGLWFFQRPTPADIEARLFRGRLAFLMQETGTCELRLERYRPECVDWLGGWLEPDPEDQFLAATGLPETPRREPPARAWAREAYWQERRNALGHGLARFRQPLEAAFEAVRLPMGHDFIRHANGRVVTKDIAGPNDLRLLFAAWKITGGDMWRRRLMEELEPYLDLPHWSGKAEDIYGYGGDYAVAHAFRVLAGLLKPLREVLDAQAHARLKACLLGVGNRFLECALLMRDYWGGSVLQDHGIKSVMAFTAGALALRGEFEAAERWLCWALPRMERVLAAVPRDGIPPSSYQSLRLYTAELLNAREELLAWTGRDLLHEEPWRRLPDSLEPAWHHPTVSPWQVDGGHPFLSALAEEFGDPRAQAWEESLLSRLETVYGSRILASAVLESFLVRTEHPPVEARAADARPLYWLRDSGWVACLTPRTQWGLVVRAGPVGGYHAFAHASGPCDRLGGPPTEGHFRLARRGRPLFASPASPYFLHSGTGSILSINGRGQVGDIGYPMSLPAWNGPWGEIRLAQWEPREGRARIVVDLSRVYPPECGLLAYTREWVLEETSDSLRIIDRLALAHPAELTWRFQLAPEVDSECHEAEARLLLAGERFRFRAVPPERLSSWTIAATRQIHSYTSDGIPHTHLLQTTRTRSAGGVFEWILGT